LPTVSFEFGAGVTVEIPPSGYIIKTGDLCVSLILGYEQNNRSSPVWLLGTTFLRQVYTVFDIENERIGFAKARMATISIARTALVQTESAIEAQKESQETATTSYVLVGGIVLCLLVAAIVGVRVFYWLHHNKKVTAECEEHLLQYSLLQETPVKTRSY
jgi:hypothetical protein